MSYRADLSPTHIMAITHWLVEQAVAVPHQPCACCGHDASHHRFDDSGPAPTDPEAKARCVWPMPEGPAVRMCTCANYVGGVVND